MHFEWNGSHMLAHSSYIWMIGLQLVELCGTIRRCGVVEGVVVVKVDCEVSHFEITKWFPLPFTQAYKGVESTSVLSVERPCAYLLLKTPFFLCISRSICKWKHKHQIYLALNKTSKFSLSPLESNLEHADTWETQNCFLPCRPLQRGLKMSQRPSKP